MRIETKYKLKQRVQIKEIELNGTVMAVGINCDGILYKVRWFNDGKLMQEDFFEEELSMEKPKGSIGVGFTPDKS